MIFTFSCNSNNTFFQSLSVISLVSLPGNENSILFMVKTSKFLFYPVKFAYGFLP